MPRSNRKGIRGNLRKLRSGDWELGNAGSVEGSHCLRQCYAKLAMRAKADEGSPVRVYESTTRMGRMAAVAAIIGTVLFSVGGGLLDSHLQTPGTILCVIGGPLALGGFLIFLYERLRQ